VRLDDYRNKVFPTYEADINEYLQRFGAGFRLQGMSSTNTRGGSSVTYSVLINRASVPLAGNGGPSFRSALSSGDRNTLALAFFFAALQREPNLSDRIVIIDDPMSSLDEHRTLVTIQEITRLLPRVAQVVVLSHSKLFLMSVWAAAPRNQRAAMRIVRAPNSSSFSEWNVTADSVTEHDRRHDRVNRYLQASDPLIERQVAMDLRPMLEAYTRVAYPGEFSAGSLLGPFIGECQRRHGQANQLLDPADTTDLRAILDYANRFHHDSNPAWQTETINDQELASFCRRTISFIQR
jgi:wobble nucleotide-excising tRNase